MDIQMVDLKSQYLKIKKEIDSALISCIESTLYIKGPEVLRFEESLSKYLNVKYAVGCGNGTDALQIALMALGLKQGDEVLVPAFSYPASIEAIALLGLTPVLVDINIHTFNISIKETERAITLNTKVIIPVHLYGQSANMEGIMKLAKRYNLFVIEDNAQALGAEYTFSNGTTHKTGTIGDIACHSFFPSKNLGCFGDGGAITSNNADLAERCRMIASHGQKKKYHHTVIGCNSRLDSIQAVVLNIKLKYLNNYIAARQKAADYYHTELKGTEGIALPKLWKKAAHTFNQFTILVKNGKRDKLQTYLKEKGIPSIIYYPLPLYKQEAYKIYCKPDFTLPYTEYLCDSVLSLPMHTELNFGIQDQIIKAIKSFNC